MFHELFHTIYCTCPLAMQVLLAFSGGVSSRVLLGLAEEVYTSSGI